MKVEIRSKVVILLCIVLAVFSSCITDDDDDRGDFALVAGDALPQFSVEMSDGGVLCKPPIKYPYKKESL